MSISSTTSASSSTSTAMNSIYSSIASKNTGIGGLISGLDTDNLVEALTLGTRTKIAKQQQTKTTWQWKQTKYRDIIDELNTFRDRYFRSTDLSKNMKYDEYYNSYKGTSSSDALTVNGDKCRNPGTVTIKSIDQVATSTTVSTDYKVSQLMDDMSGDQVDLFNFSSYAGKEVKLTLNNSITYTVDLTALSTDLGSGKTVTYLGDDGFGNMIPKTALWDSLSTAQKQAAVEYKLQSEIDSKIKDTNGQGLITVNIDWDSVNVREGSISFDGGANTVTVKTDCDELGLTAGMTNRIDFQSIKLNELFDLQGNSFTFSINNGTTDTVVTVAGDITLEALFTAVNNCGANVKMSYDSVTDSIVLTNLSTGELDLDFKDITGNLMSQMFGVDPGTTFISGKGNGSAAITYGYDTTIEGSAVSLSPEDLLNHLDSFGGSFKITLNDGTAMTVNLASSDANALIASLTTSITNHMTQWETKWSSENGGATPPQGPGTDYDIEKERITSQLYTSSVLAWINEEIVDQTGSSDVTFYSKYDDNTSTYTYGFSTDANTKLLIDPDSSFLTAFGIPAADNNYTPDNSTKFKDVFDDFTATSGFITFTRNDSTTATIPYTDTMSFRDLQVALAVNGIDLILNADGTIEFDFGSTPFVSISDSESSDGLMNALFGTDSYALVNADASITTIEKPGQNAQITLDDGSVVVMNTNDFYINGIDFTIEEEYSGSDPIVINVVTDISGMVAKLTEFINDYNAVYASIFGTVSESTYREEDGTTYAPLTEEQRAEMSEKEIEAWEEKAKQGILQNDPVLNRLLGQMRGTFYPKQEDIKGVPAYMFGLTTQSIYSKGADAVSYQNSGQMQLDEKMLTTFLEQNGDTFRISMRELASTLDDIILASVNEGTGSEGTLVKIAGSNKSTGSEPCTIDKRIELIDKYISRLKLRLEHEYNRYWKKFSALESAIANMSSQTSWLSELE